MNRRQLQRLFRLALFISLAAALLAPLPALAQSGVRNLRAAKISHNSITVKWDATPGFSTYEIFYSPVGSNVDSFELTNGTSFTIRGLRPQTNYRIVVGYGHLGHSQITVRTAKKTEPKKVIRYVPPDVTCPHLPPRVVVSDYIENTQCQMVGEVVISGQPDLHERGFIDAVDVWNVMPAGGVEVCFHYHGWLIFLDAAYAPRMVTELDHTHRDGMTCGRIDRAGTVVLLASAPSLRPVTQPAENTLPVFEATPLSDCQIKLVETLFLRAEPGGEIIGLVWLNSEVYAFEINGYWYKIEFEGVTGYISRYYREVLRGGCG